MADYDIKDITPIIGKCGRFQILVTLASNSTLLVCVWGFMFMSFAGYNPGWTCLDQLGDLNSTDISSTPSSSTVLVNKEILNSTNWDLDCDVKRNCESLSYKSESRTVTTEWYLSCDLDWIPSMIISIQMTGSLLGGFIGGQIGDKFGRKVSLYLHVAFHGICHFIATLSTSWQMYATVFFFVGVSGGGILANCDLVPLEFANEWWRGFIVSIPVWNISYFIFTVVVFALRDWQQLHIVSAIICILAFLPVFWFPESLRWLTVSGKIDQAKHVVTRISRINKRPCPDTSIIDEIANEEKTRIGDHIYTYLDLFRVPVLRGYSIKFGIIWVSMSCVYYGISFGIKALSGDFYVNLLISSVLEIPGMLLVAPLVNKFGRRISALLFFGIQVACCVALVIILLVTSGIFKDKSVLILALFCKMINVASWAVLVLYPAELYPTVIRSISFGYLNAISRLGSIISPYLISDDPETLYISFIMLGTVGVINIGIALSLPESKGTIMKDTTRFDNLETMPMQNNKEQISVEDKLC